MNCGILIVALCCYINKCASFFGSIFWEKAFIILIRLEYRNLILYIYVVFKILVKTKNMKLAFKFVKYATNVACTK